MQVTIQNYRGIEIWFNTNEETFQCDIDDSRSIKKSYSAVIKFIDDFRKDSENFKSFWIEPKPYRYDFGEEKLKVVGIRKDGRFITEGKDGKKEQFPTYSEDSYILVDQLNDPIKQKLKDLENEQENLDKRRDNLMSGLIVKTIKDYRRDLGI